jgi:hypothetical protein
MPQHPLTQTAIRFYLKLSKGWGWSGQNFHPHLTHFLTTENPKWHGPAASHLTLYIEPVGGKLRLADAMEPVLRPLVARPWEMVDQLPDWCRNRGKSGWGFGLVRRLLE